MNTELLIQPMKTTAQARVQGQPTRNGSPSARASASTMLPAARPKTRSGKWLGRMFDFFSGSLPPRGSVPTHEECPASPRCRACGSKEKSSAHQGTGSVSGQRSKTPGLGKKAAPCSALHSAARAAARGEKAATPKHLAAKPATRSLQPGKRLAILSKSSSGQTSRLQPRKTIKN